AGAAVTAGSMTIGGEARNFAFARDGGFVTMPGFGVFLTLGGANGGSFKWPDSIPIHIDSIGIVWPNIQADPGDFKLMLSASVTSIKGMGDAMEFEGSIDGIVIDVHKLLAGDDPIVHLAAL